MSISSLILFAALVLPVWSEQTAAPRANAASEGARHRSPSGVEAEDLLLMSLSAPEVSYEGELVLETVSPKGESVAKHVLVRFAPPDRYRREIVDENGFMKLLIVSDGETEWVYDRRRRAAWRGEPTDADHKLIDPDEEYDLIFDNYELKAGGSDRVAGRDCAVLEVREPAGGALVQKLSIDRERGLVLRRRVYRPDGGVASHMRYLRAVFSPPSGDWDFAFSPPSGTKVAARRIRPDFLEVDEVRTATDLEPRQPDWLPGGYVFESVNILPYRGRTVLHYRYSDGVEVLSLFQAPRHMPVRHSGSVVGLRVGSAQAKLAVGADGKMLEWTAGDRFVLIGRLSVETMKRVAESIK